MNCKKNSSLLLLGLCLGLFSCSDEEKKQVPDVSHIEVNVDIRRFEQSLFQLDTNNIEAAVAELHQAYPDLADIFIDEILDADNAELAPEGAAAYLKGFIQHPPLRHLYDTVQVIYPDLNNIESEFETAFRYYQYYFPEMTWPSVSTIITEYGLAAFLYGENDLAVGLDLFLGENYPYQKYNPDNPAFSQYLTRTFNRDHLVAKAIQALVEDLAGVPAGNRLLDQMIHNGKKLYVLDKILPYTADSVKWEVSALQAEWLTENELEMWAFFIKEDLFYSSDWGKIRKYIDYSPNSPGMPPEAPGRTANWLGYKVVAAYHQRYPELSLTDLMALSDAQFILDESKYKPRR
ncbi:MAG TPA: hypothetical protein PKA00_12805 [Saprospiraceae bacterium]|nr:hypothetical protein [Saprospiraceae bacterium]HMQ83788.1 hypothetical protein [Saprospiraceae bacterium]